MGLQYRDHDGKNCGNFIPEHSGILKKLLKFLCVLLQDGNFSSFYIICADRKALPDTMKHPENHQILFAKNCDFLSGSSSRLSGGYFTARTAFLNPSAEPRMTFSDTQNVVRK